jgi:hypothetical protein
MRTISVFKAVSSCRFHSLSIVHYALRDKTHMKPRQRHENLRVQHFEIRAHPLGVEVLLDDALGRVYLPLLADFAQDASSTVCA